MTPRKILTFALGPIAVACLSLFLIPMIAWMFSQEDVGRLAVLQMVLSFSTLFFSLGLDQAYAREFHGSDNKQALFKMALYPGLILLSIVLTGLFFNLKVLSYFLFDLSDVGLGVSIIIMVLVSFLLRYFALTLRMGERALSYSVVQILPKLSLIIIIVVYWLFDISRDTNHLLGAHVASLIMALLVCLIYVYDDLFNVEDQKVALGKLCQMLKFGFPLIFAGTAYWGLTAIDKIFLRLMSTFEELGVYAVAVGIAGMATLLQNVFSTVWAPLVYKWVNNGDNLSNVDRVRTYVLAIVVFCFIAGGLLSSAFPLLFPVEYLEIKWIVVACMGAPLFYTLSEITVVGVSVVRKTSYLMAAAFIALSVNIVANWFLIPVYGAAGAASSTCFAFYVFFLLRTEFSILLWRDIPRYSLYSYATLCASGSIAQALYGEYLENWIYVFWFILFCMWLKSFKFEIKKAIFYLRVKF